MTEPKDLMQRLTGLMGPGTVIAEGPDLEPYAVDWRKLFPGKPACVVRPSSKPPAGFTDYTSVLVDAVALLRKPA